MRDVPTMTYDDFTKEAFYAELDKQIRQTPKEDKLLVMGNFNASVGSCHDSGRTFSDLMGLENATAMDYTSSEQMLRT